MRILKKYTQDAIFTKIVGIGLAVMFAWLLSSTASAQLTDSAMADIPDGANRIILTQEGVSPANVYVDAYKMLQRMDYTINTSANTLKSDSLEVILAEDPLVFTAEKQVNDDMAIRLSVNVKKVAGGGVLIASAEYAKNVAALTTEWKQAKWTDGLAKHTFSKALEALHNAQYSAIKFETGVAVASM